MHSKSQKMKKLTLLLAAALMITGGAYAQEKSCCKKGAKCTKSSCCKDKKNCSKDGAQSTTNKSTTASKSEQAKPKA